MGIVYLAEPDDRGASPVAIKVLRPDCAWPDAARRLRVEAVALARLDHPHIARLLDGGRTEEAAPFVVMEFVPGEHVDQFAGHHRLTVNQRVELFIPVCHAVGHAHDRAVIHRDLKPSNILVTPAGSPKLLDFGIAKLVDPSGRGLGTTATGFALMTPQYASPEQILGERVAAPSDVYALGVILYELVTGELPYRPTSPSPFAWAETVINRAPTHPASHRPDLDQRLTAVLFAALVKDPAARTMTAAHMAHYLRDYLGSS
jgi:serine/threonine protein kinase